MEVALRRRLEGVTEISISESRQTAEVQFAQGAENFSPQAFREAVKQAGVEVLTFQIEACGILEKDASGQVLAAGQNRFLVMDVIAAGGEAVCVSGRLDDRTTPHRLDIAEMERRSGS